MDRVAEKEAESYRQTEEYLKPAAALLDQYGLGGARLTALNDADGLLFRVSVPDSPEQPGLLYHPYLGRIAGRRFALRVQNEEANGAAIHSEMVWLAALLRDTGLTVPEPVPTLNGSLLGRSLVAGGPGKCVLLRWVEGRSAGMGPRTSALNKVGRYMGALHNYSASYLPPAEFQRPRWDWERLFGAGQAAHRTGHATRLFGRDDLVLFEAASEQVGRAMQTLGEGRGVFGLIHADLCKGNYLFHRGEVRAVDFSKCGWGYYLFDIASTLATLRSQPDYPQLHTAFLTGYRSVRRLSEAHESLIETFMLARHVAQINRMLGWQQPTLRAWVPRFIEKSVEELRRLPSSQDENHS